MSFHGISTLKNPPEPNKIFEEKTCSPRLKCVLAYGLGLIKIQWIYIDG